MTRQWRNAMSSPPMSEKQTTRWKLRRVSQVGDTQPLPTPPNRTHPYMYPPHQGRGKNNPPKHPKRCRGSENSYPTYVRSSLPSSVTRSRVRQSASGERSEESIEYLLGIARIAPILSISKDHLHDGRVLEQGTQHPKYTRSKATMYHQACPYTPG